MIVLRYVIVMAAALISTYTDVRINKIKNCVTAPVAVIGLALAAVDPNMGIKRSLLGMVLPFVICLAFYLLKMLRAGDVKLYMCMGAVMGVLWIAECMAYSVVVGGVIAVAVAVKRKCLLRRFKRLWLYIKYTFILGKPTQYNDDDDTEGIFPYAAAIMGGTVVMIIKEMIVSTARF